MSPAPMSKPERVVLLFATIGICALVVGMMKRVLDFQATLNSSAERYKVEEARVQFPAGPRRPQ